MAQETLEEAAERYVDYNLQMRSAVQKAVIFGAKWQAQRMYSEEEVLKLLLQFYKDKPIIVFDATQWFEQFKKQ